MKVVALVGSARFKERFLELEKELTVDDRRIDLAFIRGPPHSVALPL